jgi:hypothetical protein
VFLPAILNFAWNYNSAFPALPINFDFFYPIGTLSHWGRGSFVDASAHRGRGKALKHAHRIARAHALYQLFSEFYCEIFFETRSPAHACSSERARFFNFLNYYYILLDDGSISVRNVAFSPENEFTQICGYADVPDVSEPGALSVHFPGAPAGSYWVIGTDYENYASIYSCKSFLVFNLEYSWVLVRDPANVTPEIKQAALKAFTDNGLSLDNFEDTVQSNCTYEDPNVPPCKTED